MPSIFVTEQTPMLSEMGWRAIGYLPNDTVLWGIDRHGKWQAMSVTTRLLGEVNPIYLGSQTCFSSLAPQTRVLLRNGRSNSAEDIVQEGNIGDIWFESSGDLPSDPTQAHIAIDDAFAAIAAFCSKSRLGIRRVWPIDEESTLIGEKLIAYQCITAGGSQFVILQRAELRRRIGQDWTRVILALAEVCFKSADGQIQVPREAAALLAWCVSACRVAGLGYRLNFESLQSTTIITLETTKVLLPPVSRGSCACKGVNPMAGVSVSWNSSGWTPIAGGFLLGTS